MRGTWKVEGPLPTPPPLPPSASPGRRWRWRRDFVILVASRAGLSQRFLADVFDLPRSRIGMILKKVADSPARP